MRGTFLLTARRQPRVIRSTYDVELDCVADLGLSLPAEEGFVASGPASYCGVVGLGDV